MSILKFIEKNRGLTTTSTRSRDNLPNPITNAANPYLPTNPPAIDDTMNFLQFRNDCGAAAVAARRRSVRNLG
ncbi:MAG: hypothetical protein M0002_08530 [Rhodospirillales bacterium]|nr:hypothetical protein [Rhodospirillales bacterium]